MPFRRTVLASAILAASVEPAWAQLEEVVVTAQRRSESMQDVAVAVSAIGSNDIENLGWEDPADVALQVPNMQVSTVFGDAQPLFAIRGVSMVDYTAGQAGPIGLYADETYIGATFLHGLAMFDLERIEVLRGPQGTLYGKNTTGGAINLITRTPDIGTETNGYLLVGGGDYGLVQTNGAIEGSLGDSAAGRIAFRYKENDGWWENETGDDMFQTKNFSVRGTLNWDLADNFNAVLKLSHGESDPRTGIPRGQGTGPGGLNISGSIDSLDPQFGGGATDVDGESNTELSLANLRLTWDLGDYTIVSVTSWYDGEYFQDTDVDGTRDPIVAIDWAADTDAISQDLRLQSNFDGPFNFIAGVYYADEQIEIDRLHDSFFGAPVTNPVLPGQAASLLLQNGTFGEIYQQQDLTKESWAVYGDMNWDLSERLSLNLGLRFTNDEITRDFNNVSRLNGGPLVLPPAITGAPVPIVADPRTEGSYLPGNPTGVDAPLLPPNPGAGFLGAWTHGELDLSASTPTLSETEEEVTGTIALTYQLTDNSITYARYSRGYRSGNFNGGLLYLDEGDEAYADPEYVDAYEIGYKGEFLDGLARLNAAAFYYDYTDQQFVNQVGISAILENAGGVDIAGLELEFLAAPTDALTLQAGLGLIDAEYNELVLTGVDLEGNEPVSTPELNFNVAADYEIDMTEKWRAIVHVDGTFIDDQWFSAYNDQVVPGLGDYGDIGQEAYWLWNARLTFADETDRYAITAWVSNLTDEEYDVYAINLQSGFSLNYFMQGPPRLWGVDFTYRF